MPYLSIIIPAFNEAERISETLLSIQKYLSAQQYESEVLVVDDGSSDKTVEVVKKISQNFPQLRVIENTVNKGKGGVVKQGLLEAKGDYRLFTDADNSTPIEEISNLLEYVPPFQVVIGSRYVRPGSIKVKQPLRRRILSRASNALIQIMLLPGIKDTQCGFKLFSAEATRVIFPHQHMTGWSFDFEVLAIAKKMGYAIQEVPVDWYDSKLSTLRASGAAYQSFKDLVAVRKELQNDPPQKQKND